MPNKNTEFNAGSSVWRGIKNVWNRVSGWQMLGSLHTHSYSIVGEILKISEMNKEEIIK